MKIKRSELLSKLEAATAGLSKSEILEQSNSFIFYKGEIITFNDEILVRQPYPIGFDAIILADDLLGLLSKISDEEIEITLEKSEIVIEGRRKKAGIKIDSDIRLPFDSIPKPDVKHKLDENISKMLQRAADACGKDETQPLILHIHATPDLIEACDNFQLFRFTGNTGFPGEMLIPSSSMKRLNKIIFTEVSIGKGWCHFGFNKGLISIRCSNDKYLDVGKALKMDSCHEITLPIGLEEILERAMVMNEAGGTKAAIQNRSILYDAIVSIKIEKGRFKIESRKETGWYSEWRRSKYDGEPLIFAAHPKLLMEILRQSREAKIDDSKSRMKISTKDIQYVITLQTIK